MNLRRVLAHNHQDVVSLMLLLARLACPQLTADFEAVC